MMATTSSEPLDAAREAAAAWRFLHDLFRPPSPAQWTWLRSAPTLSAWNMLAETCGLDLPEILPNALAFRKYEETFVAAFDVGFPVAACPLIETHWNRREPVTSVLHENVLFYKQFGLMIRTEGEESPDHVLPQTEFMCYLHTLEEQALRAPAREDQVAQIRQAEKDFLERHLAYWTPLAARRIEESIADTWPARWVRILAEFSREAAEQHATEATGS